MNSPDLPLWVITENPKDFPGLFVVRRHVVIGGCIAADAEPTGTAKTLEEARGLIPDDTVCLPPSAEDDPVIVEIWI